MDSRGEPHESVNASHRSDQKHPSFPSLTCSYNTKQETGDFCMSVNEEAIRKPTGRVNPLLSYWGALTTSDTMQTGSTRTGPAPTRWTRMLWSMRSITLKSMTNATQHWEGTGVPRIAKDDWERKTQQQNTPSLQSEGIR